MSSSCPDTIATDPVLCPECGARGKSVKVRTIKQWLATSLVPGVPAITFHFCSSKGCPVVYFSEDRSTLYTLQQLRNPVSIKEGSSTIPVCYCFGVTEEMIAEEIRKSGASTYSSWIAGEMKEGNCACEVRNPSGRCCLGEVKKVEGIHAYKGEKK